MCTDPMPAPLAAEHEGKKSCQDEARPEQN